MPGSSIPSVAKRAPSVASSSSSRSSATSSETLCENSVSSRMTTVGVAMKGIPRTCSASTINCANSERMSSTTAGSIDSEAVPGTEMVTCDEAAVVVVVESCPSPPVVVVESSSPPSVVVAAEEDVVVVSASGLHTATTREQQRTRSVVESVDVGARAGGYRSARQREVQPGSIASPLP